MSAGTADEESYKQDGEVAKRIAAVIPYYPYKGIPRFYDINGFLQRPEVCAGRQACAVCCPCA